MLYKMLHDMTLQLLKLMMQWFFSVDMLLADNCIDISDISKTVHSLVQL